MFLPFFQTLNPEGFCHLARITLVKDQRHIRPLRPHPRRTHVGLGAVVWPGAQGFCARRAKGL
ncbi:MAG: hypothetical protein B7Z31_03220 [Rhodobacterales bacterium 12-65-15]|nr:MAG: hypothetical protein B7Z31_03220 [Rhodobacterales bacterium 12-65-15]